MSKGVRTAVQDDLEAERKNEKQRARGQAKKRKDKRGRRSLYKRGNI